MRQAACLVLAGAGLFAPALAGDEIYYRRDANGALVLTNVPDRPDLRAYRGHGPLPVTHSGEEFRELIERASLQHGIHPDLVFAVAAVESNFNSRAVSEKGAQGLMQLMPDTAARFGVVDPFNPAENVLGGVNGSTRSEEHTSELQSRLHLVCRLLLEKKKKKTRRAPRMARQLSLTSCLEV